MFPRLLGGGSPNPILRLVFSILALGLNKFALQQANGVAKLDSSKIRSISAWGTLNLQWITLKQGGPGSRRSNVSGNLKRWRQTGSPQWTPLSTIRTQYGNSLSIPEATPTCKREVHTEFQYRPHIVDTDTIADAVFADAVSETSNLGFPSVFLLFLHCLS